MFCRKEGGKTGYIFTYKNLKWKQNHVLLGFTAANMGYKVSISFNKHSKHPMLHVAKLLGLIAKATVSLMPTHSI
jgi:hypothetical protein